MSSLPFRPNIDHLKRQAKDLLADYQAGRPSAFDRLRASLPAARGRDDAALAAMTLRLHDAQSCLAREYGFHSWDDLRTAVLVGRTDEPHLVHRWLGLVYGVHERADRPHPAVAARVFNEARSRLITNLIVACAVGDVGALQNAGVTDPARVNEPIVWRCPECDAETACPPLAAVALSSLVREPVFAGAIRTAVRELVAAGADPNARWQIGQYSLSALYGAAGLNHDAGLTRVLLEAGADPNDHESLYHATESPDPACVTLLLEHGARVEGSNALHHQLDRDDVDGLRRLLAFTRDADDPTSSIGRPLLWAIRRCRSAEHVRLLIEAGADPRVRTHDGVSAYVLAERNGLRDVADVLRQHGAAEPLSVQDAFVAACASADRDAVSRILADTPEVIGTLTSVQLRQLPGLAAAGRRAAVELMVEVGWPIDTPGGDWNASALNLAVFRGDAALTRFLLEHGARWTAQHGYRDNAMGTLSWASRNHDPAAGDWVGCARALLDHGMPVPPEDREFSDAVADLFAERRRLRNDG